jgi:hypothetical protein
MGKISGSISIPSASYSQDVEFFFLLHIGKEGLASKVVSVRQTRMDRRDQVGIKIGEKW